MKIFTKEWYKKMQCAHFYIGLKSIKYLNDDNIEEATNEIYKKIKENRIDEWMKFDDKIKELSGIGINSTKEDLAKLFDERIDSDIDQIEYELPEYILNKISNIKLLALGFCKEEEFDLLKDYSLECEKYINDTIKDYNEYIDKEFKDAKIDFIEESFHDCDIVSSKMINNDLELKLNNEGGFTDKNSIIFKNATIILDDDIVDNAYIYDEIYKHDNKLEIHILTRGNGFRELILECEDIIVK